MMSSYRSQRVRQMQDLKLASGHRTRLEVMEQDTDQQIRAHRTVAKYYYLADMMVSLLIQNFALWSSISCCFVSERNGWEIRWIIVRE